MFGLTILEIMYIVTTIMSGIMLIVYVEEAFRQIENSFIKLKEERKTLECKVQTLEKELVESSIEEDSGFNPDGKPKYITIFDKKGNIIEETSFDESGVKTEIIINKKN